MGYFLCLLTKEKTVSNNIKKTKEIKYSDIIQRIEKCFRCNVWATFYTERGLITSNWVCGNCGNPQSSFSDTGVIFEGAH